MRILKSSLAVAIMASVAFSCAVEENVQPDQNAPERQQVSQQTLDQILQLGFSNENVIAVDNGDLQEMSLPVLVSEEHYRTTNTVTGLPRTISIYVGLASNFVTATDEAIARYNAENLDITFQRVSSSAAADISIVASPWYYRFFGILGSAGFPTASGDPFNQIQITTSFYSGVTGGALTTTIAHEVGHCIGFRHTDYADRSYSCGGATDNEGDGGVGAVYIPGTPTGPEAGSWMLACSDGTDRPFTSGDQTALSTLY